MTHPSRDAVEYMELRAFVLALAEFVDRRYPLPGGLSHHDELRHDWALLHSGRPPLKMEPLRELEPKQMDHPIHRVERFEIVGPYTLVLEFDDGTQQRIDSRPVLEGEVFGPLQDLEAFNAVELDSTFGTIQWPNGADVDPETRHDWPVPR